MQTTWMDPGNVLVAPLYFWLVIDGEFKSTGFLHEQDVRGLWRTMYANGEVKDTQCGRVYAGITRDRAYDYAPIN